MEVLSEDDLCWIQLEDFRMLLIKNIDPSKITPYLRQCQVISAEDEEQLFNDPNLVIRRRKVGALLDILQRTGVKGYTAFLESLELDYPRLYTRITGKEPNKTFSILIDTAGESGLTQFLMSELSRLQRALQDERRRRQQACAVAKEQEEWSRKQQQREAELTKLTDRVQKLREERQRLSEEVKRLREHNYSLMADINSLNQEKSAALLANKDLQIQVERLNNTVLRAENQARLLRRRTQEVDRSRSLALHPPDMFYHPNRLEEQKEKKEEEKQEQKEEEKQEQKEEEQKSPPQTTLLTTVFRLRRDLHRAEEQRSRCQEEKEELELRFTQMKGDAKMYRQRHQQTLKHMEEVMRERDKALTWRSEQQEEVRLLLQEKDRYREQVRQLTEQSDRLELLLLRSEGEELQLKTRLHRITCNKLQCERSVSSDEEEEPTDGAPKGTCEEAQNRMSAENQEAASPSGGHKVTTASWDESGVPNSRGRPNFFYRRKRALRSKCHSKEYAGCALDDSSDMTDSETSQKPNMTDSETSQKPNMTDSETSQKLNMTDSETSQ